MRSLPRRHRVFFLSVFLFVGSGSSSDSALQAQPPSGAVDDRLIHYPDMVVVNGKVVTVDDGSSIQEALAIRRASFWQSAPPRTFGS